MPVDYSKYPPNWKNEIRPAILARENHSCKFCRVKNGKLILRGEWGGELAFQDMDGNIFNALNGDKVGEDYVGELEGSCRYTKIVLTVAHLDHNIGNNAPENLAALCQKCHLSLDAKQHQENARLTREAKRGLQRMF